MWHTVAAVGLILPLITGPVAGRAETTDPPAGKIAADLISVNGSGCPRNSVASGMNPDNTMFYMTFSNYLAQSGPGLPVVEARKNCQLTMAITAPPGMTYAITRADYLGYASLPENTTGRFTTNLYFQGTSPKPSVQHYVTGPIDDMWQASDIIDADNAAWLPCGDQRNLNLNTEIRLPQATSGSPERTAFMHMGGDCFTPDIRLRLTWRTCQPTG
jgi:hypothetical protein